MNLLKIGKDCNVEKPRLILARRDHTHIGMLEAFEDLEILDTMANEKEISFTIYKYLDRERSVLNPLWDEVTDFKFIYVPEAGDHGEYFEIYVNIDEDLETTKSVSGISAGKAELSQSLIYELEINTDEDIQRSEYEIPTVFYDPDHPEASLLNRALEKIPQWSINHVDNSLGPIQRTFSVSSQTVYDFFVSTIAKEIGCLFKFDSVNRQISVYDLKTVCLNCGYRGEYSDVCPECGSDVLKVYGNDTSIYLDQENISTRLKYTTDTDSVKNCFRMEAGDDNMNAAIANRNPNGSMYLYYFSEDQKAEMPDELVERLEQYDELVASYDEEYSDVILNIYNTLDQISYLTSEMMPPVEFQPTTAEQEAAKLTAYALGNVGIEKLSSSTSIGTVNNVMQNYAKLFIRSGWYKAKVKNGQFTYIGQHESGYYYGIWTGNFTVTSWADEEETADSDIISIEVKNDYATYMEQRLQQRFKEADTDEGSEYDVLSIKDVDTYTEAITHYGLNRLQSFADALQGALDIIIEMGQASVDTEFYEEIYLPLRQKLKNTQAEIDVRQSEIDEQNDILETAQNRQQEIHKILNFRNFLGEDLYLLFCCYKREDVYSNSNYISDNLENKELLEHATEFIKAASDELFKSGEFQHSISGSFTNFLIMPEFDSFKDSFEIGDFLRLRVNDKLYRLRLISIEISFKGNTPSIDIEFSDMTSIPDGASDLKSILDSAKSVASSYGYVTHQMDKSIKSSYWVDHWVNKGFEATVTKIVSDADYQTQTWDEHGILCRRFDPATDTYSDNQVKIFNNGFYYTNDNWESAKSALGEFYYWNPKSGSLEIGYGLLAETIVGNLILSEEVGIYTQNGDIQLNENGLILTADATSENAKPMNFTIQRKVLDNGEEAIERMMYMDSNAHLYINGGDVTIYTSHSGAASLDSLIDNSRFDSIESQIEEIKTANAAEWNDINSWINISADGIILGQVDSDLALAITSNSISFTKSGAPVATFQQQLLEVEQLQAKSTLIIGNFVFRPRSNGSLDFKKNTEVTES